MTATLKKEQRLGPEDVRPPLQVFIQAKLVYKGTLLEVRESMEKQLGEASNFKTKAKLSTYILEINKEINRIDSGIEINMGRVKRSYLRSI